MSGTYFKNGALIESSATTATAGGTTTLTASSATNQQFTGTAIQTIVLPDATTLSVGRRFTILNRSTLSLTVNFNGGALAATIPAGTQADLRVLAIGTSAGTWDVAMASSGGAGVTATVTAGVNLALCDAVYISVGAADGSRTAGNAYELDATSDLRVRFAGFATAAISSTATGTVQSGGSLTGFSSLTPGVEYFASVTTPGGIQATQPVARGQWVIPVGKALNSTTLLINGAAGEQAYKITPQLDPRTNYAVPNRGAEIDTTGWTPYVDTQTVTITNASPAVFSITATAGLLAGMPVAFTTTGTLPTGLTAGTTYYVSSVDSGTQFKVSLTRGGANINTSSAGSGTHTFRPLVPIAATSGSLTGLTFSRNTVTPLRGTGDFKLAQTNSTTVAGQGIYYAFTIDAADKGRMLSLSADFNADSNFSAADGVTAPNSGGAGDSDLEWFIYDVTNALLIPVTPQTITANGANNFTFSGTFQTASNSTSYRLCLHASKTSSAATGYTFRWDNVLIGPSTGGTNSVPAPTIQKLTTSGTYVTPSNPTPLYIRVRGVGGGAGGNGGGSSAGGAGGDGTATTFGTSLLATTPTSGRIGGGASISLPAIGTAMQGSAGGAQQGDFTSPGGHIGGGNGGAGPWGGGGGGGYASGATQTAVANSGSGGGGGGANVPGTTVIGGQGGGAGGFFDAIIPNPVASYAYVIGTGGSGGSAGTNGFAGGAGATGYIEVTEYYSPISADAINGDGRVVAASMHANGTLSQSAGAAIKFQTTDYDTHAAYNSTTGEYVVPVAGIYEMAVQDFALGSESNVYVQVYKNGSFYGGIVHGITATGVGFNVHSGSLSVKCNAGDKLTIVDGNGVGVNYSAGNYEPRWVIQRASGSAALAPTAAVRAKYDSCGTTFTTNADTVAVFPNKLYDTHNRMNAATGEFTCPIAGEYELKVGLFNASNVQATGIGARSVVKLQKNGVDWGVFQSFVFQQTSTAVTLALYGSISVDLVPGDIIRAVVGNTSIVPTWSGNSNLNSWISIKRTGN